jgi:hypothetical protein
MAWPLDTYWLCVETNFDIDTLSPNNGWPQCIISESKPNYIRVLGPYKDREPDPPDYPSGIFGEEECAKDNIVIYNNRYPPDQEYTTYSDNPKNWTTKGYYASCPYNVNPPSVTIELRDLPPTKTQVSKAIGPFNTKEEAIKASETWNCKIAFTPAADVCSPYIAESPYPDLECSLVCALGWPMIEGEIKVEFYQMIDERIQPSPSIIALSTPLGCDPTFEPTITRCWKSSYSSNNSAEFILLTDPKRGYKLRLVGTMCIDENPNFANVSVSMEALMIGSDVNPDDKNPYEGARWTGVGSLGGRLPALGPSRNKKDMRKYGSNYIAFNPSNGISDCCISFAKIIVTLRPWVFGCDGSIGSSGKGAKIDKTCGLFNTEKAYSCASVQVSPINNKILNIENLVDRPCFYQMGQNDDSGNRYPGDRRFDGCYYCENTHNRDNEFICNPTKSFYDPKELTLTGITGEDTADFQQIQLAGTYMGVVGLKSVNNQMYLMLQPISLSGWAIEVTNQKMVTINRSWQVDQYKDYILEMYVKNTEFPFDDLSTQTRILGNNENTLFINNWPNNNIPQIDINATAKYNILLPSKSKFVVKPVLKENIIQRRTPMIIEFMLPEYNTRLLFYLLEFPSPEIAGCVDINDYPELPEQDPDLFLSMPPPIFPTQMLAQDEKKLNEIQNLQKQLENMNKVCIYLGNAIPNTKSCCGASPSFQCEKHGRCKQYGVAGPEDNMVCSSCPDFS